MLKLSLCAIGFWLFTAKLAQSADAVGFRETELYADTPRPVHISMWYPTSSEQARPLWARTRHSMVYQLSRTHLLLTRHSDHLWFFHMAIAEPGAI